MGKTQHGETSSPGKVIHLAERWFTHPNIIYVNNFSKLFSSSLIDVSGQK